MSTAASAMETGLLSVPALCRTLAIGVMALVVGVGARPATGGHPSWSNTAPAGTPVAAEAMSHTDGIQAQGGGDRCNVATVIAALPYSDTGTTCGLTDDYDEICPYNAPGSPDVVYAYTPAVDETVDISLCGNSAYDTKLYVYRDTCPGTGYHACNDDACSTPSYPDSWVSALMGVTLTAGHTYYIVVDGYGGDCGSYTIDVTSGLCPGPGDCCEANGSPGCEDADCCNAVCSADSYCCETEWDSLCADLAADLCGICAEPVRQCPPDSLFGQPVHSPAGPWNAGVSEASPGYVRYDNFSGVSDPICDIHWWGLDAYHDGSNWVDCTESNPSFEIKFYQDAGGQPGSQVCSYVVTAAVTSTGLLYNGQLLNAYSVALLDPCCTLSAGWVSIQGLGDANCWFLWMSSPSGDGSSLFWNGSSMTSAAYDLSLCLTGAYVPTYGACCEDVTGVCTDNVEELECQSPLRFTADTSCANLSPPCGQATGACCHPDGTCDLTSAAQCADTWLGPGTTCDQCPCVVPCPPGGGPEGEACGSDTNGGCNMAVPAFEPIACGQTVCGTVWAAGGLRDTDWYEITVVESTRLTWTVEAEFGGLGVVIGLVKTDPAGSGDCSTVTALEPYAVGGECEVLSISPCVPPGVYWLFVSTLGYDGLPCGSNSDYVATLTCEPCTVPFGACCATDGGCEVTAESQCTGTYWGDGTDCDPNPCPQPDIRVEPPSLIFNCDPEPAAGGSTATTGGDADLSSNVEPARKLISADRIGASFKSGLQKVHVIVSLTRPDRLLAATDFNSVNSLAALQAEVARRQGPVLNGLAADEFTLEHRYDNMAAFSGFVTEAGLNRLLKDPRVAAVEPVRMLEGHLNQGIPLMNALASRPTHDGSGMAIAVCDTGIDYTHPMLGNGGFPNAKVIGGYDFGNDDSDPKPVGNAHGTCCAGIAAGDLGTTGDYIGGVAPGAALYALKIAPDNSGSASTADMVAAWDWCVTHKNDDPANPIMVISTSFGGGRYMDVPSCDAATPAMTTAASNANAAGITVLASSGNNGWCESMGWPACISHVISVGAVYDAAFGTVHPCVDADSCVTPKYADPSCPSGYYAIDNSMADLVTSYSNSATFLDLFAPSNMAYSTDIVGATGYSSGDYFYGFGGTSAACPYAAGAVACLQSAAYAQTGMYLSPSEVRSLLATSGDLLSDVKVPAIIKPRVNLGQAIAGIGPGCQGQTLTIHNDGGSLLEVTSIDVPAWATVYPPPPFVVPAGGSRIICVEVDCDACDGSDLDDVLVIHSSDPDEPAVNIGIHVDCAICPAVTHWRSMRYHAGPVAAELAIELDPAATGTTVTCEPRRYGVQRIEVDLDADVSGLVSGTIQAEDLTHGGFVAATGQYTINGGTTLVVEFRLPNPGWPGSPPEFFGLADETCYKIDLAPHITSACGDLDCAVRVLAGDINGAWPLFGDGRTNLADMATVKLVNNEPMLDPGGEPIPENVRYDVNLDGVINLADMALVKLLNNHAVDCP